MIEFNWKSKQGAKTLLKELEEEEAYQENENVFEELEPLPSAMKQKDLLWNQKVAPETFHDDLFSYHDMLHAGFFKNSATEKVGTEDEITADLLRNPVSPRKSSTSGRRQSRTLQVEAIDGDQGEGAAGRVVTLEATFAVRPPRASEIDQLQPTAPEREPDDEAVEFDNKVKKNTGKGATWRESRGGQGSDLTRGENSKKEICGAVPRRVALTPSPEEAAGGQVEENKATFSDFESVSQFTSEMTEPKSALKSISGGSMKKSRKQAAPRAEQPPRPTIKSSMLEADQSNTAIRVQRTDLKNQATMKQPPGWKELSSSESAEDP